MPSADSKKRVASVARSDSQRGANRRRGELLRSRRPALTDSRAALGKVSGRRVKPTGRVRLAASPLAAEAVLGPQLGEFVRASPKAYSSNGAFINKSTVERAL
jgi:DNA-binding transcriptional LysR family regulator